MVARLMAFDKNKDGKLTKDEVTDERLHAMLDRADVDRIGSVDKDELLAMFAKEASTGRGGPGGQAAGREAPVIVEVEDRVDQVLAVPVDLHNTDRSSLPSCKMNCN